MSAIERLLELNSSLNHVAFEEKLSTDNAVRIISGYDLVVDATDNFEARYIINDACVLLGKIFISGSAVGMEGQLTVINPKVTACYRCIYPSPSFAEMCRSCANAGVLGPVPGMIGCWEAIETLKLIVDVENSSDRLTNLFGRQLFFDCAHAETHCFELPGRDKQCAICGDTPSITSLMDTEITLQSYRQLADQEAKCYIGGDLDEDNVISARQYSSGYLETGKKHIILDVRSRVQFGMISFSILDGVYTTSLTELPLVDFSQHTAALVNIPLHDLRKELSRDGNQTMHYLNSDNREKDVIVLCRRGIDSVVATHLLREAGLCSVFNLAGGLSAWKELNPSFPMY